MTHQSAAADDRDLGQLRDAFRARDTDAIRALFQRNPTLRSRIDEPAFAFDAPAIVAYAGDLPMVELLLELGADPNRRSRWWAGGFHALHSATPDTAARLIAAGAIADACAAAHLGMTDALSAMLRDDPGRVHERGGDGKTPLHFASSRAVVDLLLDGGADVDARDVDHRSTPAEWMLDRRRGAGRYALARHLVERGAATDVFLAAALGLSEIAGELVAGDVGLLDLRTGQGSYGPMAPSSYHIYFWTIGPGRSPLQTAAQFAYVDTLDAMLERATPLQALLFACSRGDGDSARDLVRRNPGLVASLAPDQHRAVADAAFDGNRDAVALLLELGFDPRVPGHDGGTALHIAAWQGGAEIVALLLSHPAARELAATRDAHHGATPREWAHHGASQGNLRGDYAEVERLLAPMG